MKADPSSPAGLLPGHLHGSGLPRDGEAAEDPAAPTIPRRDTDGPAPLSFAQQRLWFVQRMDPRSGAYNLPAALRLRGRLDTGVLERCLEEVVRRHEALRTVFTERDGEPVQTVLPPAPVSIAVADLRPLPAEARMADARRRAAEEALRPFDLERGPLLRASLLRLGPEEWVLLFTMHHVASDGWSIGVLVDEVSALYDAFARGAPSPLPELPVQYADYAVWQRRRLAGAALDAQLAFWRERLRGAPPVLDLPTDRPRPALPDERGGAHAFELPDATARGVRALARAEGATSFMVLAAVFQALLARWSGQHDVSVGTPVAGRTRLETERLIGFFVNTLVLRTDVSDDPTGRELVARVREAVLAAQAHGELPFERLVEELAPERSLQHTPLFQVMFTHQFAPEPLRLSTLGVEPFATGEEPAKFDLDFTVTERPDGGMAGLVTYRAALFEPATVRRLADHFLRLAAGLAAEPARPVAGLPLAGAAERDRVLRGWNAAAAGPVATDRCVHELLAERAAMAPGAPAVLWDGGTLTHGELERRAEGLAAALRRLGVRPEVPVAAFLERSPAMLVAVLACWKAGGVHVPLDPRYPAARLALVLADAAPAVVVAETATAAALPPHTARVLLVDDPGTWPAAGDAPLAHSPSPENLAYVIHTSGSTGRPKGVRVTHRSLAATLLRCRERFGLGPGDVMPCLASYAFDIWLFEAILPLLAGGATRVVPRERVTEPERLLDDLAGATALHAVPALMRQVAQAALASPAGGLPGIRLAFVGGDRVDPEVLEEMRAMLPAAGLFVLYGPTEGTVVCAAAAVDGQEARRLLGRPLGNAPLYVLESSGEPAPVGVPGELCIGGASVARDYLGRPDLTAERFVPDPFAAGPGARMYRSGDRARWGEDGVLEFLGRTDAQVKVRGFRIEPAEVEAALAAAPGVREAAVAVRGDGPGGTRLVGYVAPEPGAELSADAVRASLRERLPDYMVPGAVVVLAALPLTPTGKVDRAALPAPEGAAEHVEPRTPAEAAVARALAEVLGVERVGAGDDFFALGGHSLLATRVVSRIRDALGVELPLRALFETPVVAELAARVEALPTGGADPAPSPAGPEEAPGPRPLSFGQQRLWFVQQLDPASAAYNMPAALRLSGRVDVALLRRCLGEVVRRHESLRTVFADAGGEPAQRVLPAAPARLPVADLRHLPPSRREAEATRRAGEEALRPFDLERGPLLRSALLRVREEEWILLFTMHHVVSDGWSMGVLVREVSALYEAFGRGEPSPLPDLPLQYPDYAAWQRRWLAGAALERQVGWWRAALAGAPATLDLPTDRPRPASPRARGASVAFHLPPETSRAVRDLARAEAATPFMVLLAAWQALLGRWAGQEDVVVGTPVAGRGRTELEPLIGFFVNTLALRADLSGGPSLRGLLGRVREHVLGAFAHQEVPFERLVEELAPERSLSHTPLFQATFALNEEDAGGLRLGGVWMEPVPPAEESVRFDLALAMEDVGGRFEGSLSFRADLFDAATARRLAEHLVRLLDAAAAKPDRPLDDVPLLGELERRRVLTEWNATARPYPLDRCVHELFAEQAARTPDALAVLSEAGTLTYAELERRSAALALHLRGLGVGPETRVGLCLERTPELVAGVLAILRAGGAYVPLDPSYPTERLLYMLRDSGAPVLVTDSALAPLFGAFGGRVVRTDADAGEEPGALSHSRTPALSHPSSPESLAYVIYTSGSTGQPKGVGVEHRSLLNFLLWYDEEVRGPDAPDLPLMSRLSFDAHARQLFPPLLRGGPVWILSAPTVADPDALLAALASRERVAFAGVPSLWAAVLERIRSGECAVPPGLVTVGVGGEALSDALAERTLETLPGVALWNHYGPTETTINASVARVRPGARVGIGRPVGNARALVLDARLAPAPVGVPGELYVGGAGVARGYLGRPETTAAAFVPDPFAGEPGARAYRTGDRVRWRADGELEYLGRVDQQLKVRGFRIEPGEVEAALAGHPEVREAAVVACGDGPGGPRLVGYVVAEAGAEPAAAEVRRWLGGRLPEYMVPSALVVLGALPLTPAGKLDRRALPAPAEGDGDAYVPPRTPTEERLAAVFAEVLKLERVGAGDDFFALGGHSLLATRVVARIRAGFGAEVPLRALFEAPTVAGLAERLDAVLAAGPAREAPPIVRVPRDGPLPLSFAQQRLWFLDRLSPGSAAYNLFYALRLRGPLDARALERALAELARRHETLRTVFVPADDGGAVQRVLPPAAPPLPAVDLAGLPEPAREAEVLRLAAAESARPFDLERGPLLRATRLRLGGAEHALLFTLPHVASDGWSMGVLMREVSALYEAFARGEASPLPELPVQYADFAAWQRAWPDGGALQRQLAYWRRRLAGAPPVLELPTDRPRPPVPGDRGGVRRFAVPAEVARGLRALARREGATLFATLLAGWQLLLARWADVDDLVVGSPVAGRSRVELEGLIGFFATTLALRGDLSGDPTLRELVGRARETVLGAEAHQDVPFERLVDEVAPDRSLEHTPLFQVVFALQNHERAELRMGPLALEPLAAGAEPAKFDLSLGLGEVGDRLEGALAFRAELFDAATVERLLERFGALLALVARDPERRVSAFHVLLPDEHRMLRAEWDASTHPHPDSPPVHELAAAHARGRPDAPAVISAAGTLSYGELLRRADRLAGRLRALGAGAETRVATLLERGPEMPLAAMAVLRAGGTVVPVDPGNPPGRVAYVLEQSGAAVLLTTAALAGRAGAFAGGIVVLDGTPLPPAPSPARGEGENDTADADALSHSRTFALSHPASPDAAAYVVYTSGSTGRPKGVVITHGSLLNLVHWHRRTLGVTQADRGTLLAAPGFDGSMWETWLYLASGAALVAVEDEEVRTSPAALRDFMLDRGVTGAFATTPLAEALLALEWPARAPLRTLITGGDALRARPAADAPFTLVNVYGPTETTVVATAGAVAPDDGGRLPDLGRAVDNVRAYLLDRWLHPVPPGAAGEVYVGGAGVSRGYSGRPGLTAERFLPDPLSPLPGARMYRTGDRARRRPEGTLEFLGRVDQQVKIRGFRIEPGEVEAVLAEAPGVGEAAVAVRRDASGAKRLAGYVVAGGGGEVAPAGIRAWLRERLPEYMVPSSITVLEALPRSPNGKTDRLALPAPDAAEDAGAYVAPRTPTETVLAGIFAEVLGVERVGVHAGFFDLGGHSLLATRAVARIGEAFGAALPLRALFEAPTVAGLVERLDAVLAAAPAGQAPPIVPVPRGGPLPLSFAQQRLWFLDRLAPGSAAYNLFYALRLRGQLNARALERALAELVRRHETLRTVFVPADDGGAMQFVLPPAPPPLPLVDLAGLPEPAREAEARRLAAAESARPFDLERGPLLRATRLRLGGAEHALLFALHHVVSDGWSMGVLGAEVSALYEAFARGEPSPLPELPVQYADFAAWQRRWLAGDVLARQLDYWRGRLAGAPPVLALPTDRPRPPVPGERGGSRPVAVPAEVADGLRALARREGATLFATLLAAWQLLLARWADEDDVVVGSPIAGRTRLELEPLIGFFVNTLALRTELSGDPTLRELVGRARETVLGAFAHQDLPFERLVEEVAPDRSLDHAPLFQVAFTLHNMERAELRMGPLTVEALDAGAEPAKFDLSLGLAEEGDRIEGALTFRAELFDGATVERLAERFGALLAAMAREPERRVSGIDLLLPDERSLLLAERDASARPRPASPPVHELVARHARSDPAAPAVVAAAGTLSYGDLLRRADHFAARLRGLGVGPETRVALCLERGPELAVAALAVLRAGGAYLPVDPAYPAGRIALLLEDSGAAAVLTTGALAERVRGFAGEVLVVDAPHPPAPSPTRGEGEQGGVEVGFSADPRTPLPPAPSPARGEGEHNNGEGRETLPQNRGRVASLSEPGGGAPDDASDSSRGQDAVLPSPLAGEGPGEGGPPLSPDAAAYVVYTSGSTGRPKGVVVTHGALLNLVRWHLDAFGVTAADRATLVAGPGFDAAVLELWPYLVAGAALHPVEDEEVRTSPAALRDFMTGRGATVAFAPTPLAEGMLGLEWPADAPLRALLTGGDALRSRPAPGLPFTLFNLYGPAETAVVATAGPVTPADDAPDVGRAIDNARTYVLDRWLHPVPPGVPGELYVGGAGVARGYLGRPELTGERFLPDPFSAEPGARMYRTGDRVRRRPEGTLEFLGRVDLQVKIRGIRVEPDEVEAVLAGAPGVREAAVTVRRDRAGEPRLAGYIAARDGEEVAPAGLRAWLRERLPEHMVPSTLTVLDGFPLTPNGKTDRAALPAPAGDADGGTWTAPRTPTEEVLAGMWEEVLGVDRVGAHAGFFELGGHSLLATRVTSRIREVFGVELPLRALFEAPTVAEFAARVDAAAREGGGVQAPPVVPVPRDGPLPLSFAQQRLWFIDQLEPGSAAYNVPQATRLRGELDVGVLRRALGEIVNRHESLRTTFHRVGGRPVQVVHPDARASLPQVDLSALGDGAREAETRRIAAEDARLPFDLARGPLRAAVLRLGDADFALLLDMHHVVSDGWSMEVLVRELSALYDAFLAGRPSPLAPLPVQYADFAAWQRKWLEGPVLERQLDWWRERLAGAPPVLELPVDRPRPRVPGPAGGSRPFALPEAASAALRALARREGATLFMTLLAGWQALLGRYAGRDDVVVGAPVAGRDRVEIEGLIGFFVNTLVMRTDLSGGPDARELLRRVRETALGAYAHADVPFERLVEEIVPARSLSHTPLFQATFSLQNAGGPGLRLGRGELEPLEAGTGTAKFDLVFAVADDGARLGGGLAYRAELWDAATVDRMLEHFGVLLSAMAAEPGRPVAELPLLHPAERSRVLEGLNDTRRDYPPGLRVHDLFAAQARRTPEAPAVAFRGDTVSYAELDARSARLANHLRRLGVGPETRVGICLERTPELPVAMLAVLRAGGAYVPLDPTYPRERLGWMQQDARVSLVLTSTALAGALPAGTRAVALDAVRAGVASESAEVEETGVLPENLSHVIFTSGSTGRPKGVMIRHSSVVVLLHWLRENVSDEERAAVLFSTSINFDVSVAEVFGTLAWGGKLVLVENALELASVAEPVVHASMVPTAAAELLRAGAIPPGVRTLNLGGEPLPADLARDLYALGTVQRVGNLYGPTEDTTYSTCSVVRRGGGQVFVGRPVANTRALVLDPGLEPVPVGVPGELYLAGDGLARGYAARPDLTAERFLPDPFGPAGSRMYRVMDRVRWRPDGELEYLGRTDFQVKVRGFRIELGEIETALRAHPAVGETVAVVREDAPGDRRIAAYLVPAAGEEAPAAGELRAWLRERVPEYMVPSAFVALDALPMTPNGKLDRLALPAPGERAGADGEYVAPRTPTEEEVARAWAATLGIERVGAHDNFFDLGGHSLLLVQLHSRLQERFGALSLAELFQHPTLADLARRLDELREEPAAEEDERRRTLDRAESRRARMARPRPGRPVAPGPAPGDEEE